MSACASCGDCRASLLTAGSSAASAAGPVMGGIASDLCSAAAAAAAASLPSTLLRPWLSRSSSRGKILGRPRFLLLGITICTSSGTSGISTSLISMGTSGSGLPSARRCAWQSTQRQW